MGRGENYASFEGEDDDSGAASFNESPASMPSSQGPSRSEGSVRRKHSRGGMVSKSGSAGHHSKSRGKSKGFHFNTESLRVAASSMITISVIGVVVCAVILYFTFVQATLPPFYGALGAAMVIMFLLCFLAARLLSAEN